MGKKSDRAEKAASKRKGNVEDDASDDDIPTSAVNTGEEESNDSETVKLSSEKDSEFDISAAIDMLTEKKMNLREPGLLSIIKHLQSHRDTEHDALDDYHDTLTTLLVRMIRRPASVKEGQLLCRLISLLALYNGADENEFVILFEKPLQSIIDGKLGAGYDDLQDYALFTLIFITFICGNEEINRNYLTYLQDMILAENLENVSGKHAGLAAYPIHLKAKAIDCWVLLASQISLQDILEKSRDEGMFEAIFQILQEGEGGAQVSRNVSAGQGLAFLWEIADSSQSSNGETHSSIEECGRLLCDDPRVVDEAIELIKRISKESSKKVSKKNRKEQRAEFRDIELWVVEATHPYEKIRMQGADFEVSSFGQARVVEALRDVLETGFHSSLRAYPIVKEVMGVEYVTDDMDGGGLTTKIAKDSTQSKRRTQDRQQDRKYRNASSGEHDFWSED